MSRIALGLSGGVDSAVSAWMLKRDGHDVVAITLLFSDLEHERARYVLAAEVAAKLGIEHHTVDARELYAREVLKRFSSAHAEGLSPDPFVLQNERVVLPQLREAALQHACSKVATGHYASITAQQDAPGMRPLQLTVASDRFHDQTYYLASLTQKDLATMAFPLWDTAAPVVRMLAMRAGLMMAELVENPQVGFLEGVGKVEWLESAGGVSAQPGRVVHVTTQEVLGQHHGLHRYELGSAVGFGPGDLHVIAKDVAGNRLLVGPRALAGAEQCMVRGLNWISIEAPEAKRSCKALVDARRKPVPVQVVPMAQGALVTFNDKVEGLVPGNPIVFYSDRLVLGGGTILG